MPSLSVSSGRSKQRYIPGFQIADRILKTDILQRIADATPQKIVLLSVKITPEMALDILTLNQQNRHVRKEDVARWVRDMKEGRWKETGGSICISKGMRLLDGQHRLISIHESGTTQVYNIITGLDEEVYTVIDIGRIRTGADVLSNNNFTHPTTMAAAIKSDIYYRRHNTLATNLHQSKVANYEITEWVNNQTATKLMETCVEYAHTTLHKKAPFLSHSSWAFIYYILSCKNRSAATAFVTKLATGDGVSTTTDSAIFLCRDRLVLMAIKKGNKKQSMWGSANFFVKAHLIVTAWNWYRKGSRIKVLNIDLEANEIPEII